MTQCFVIEETKQAPRYLRRYHSSAVKCNGSSGYHDAMVLLDTVDVVLDGKGNRRTPMDGEPPHEAWAGWPSHCDCGYEFQPDDEWQLFADRMYRRADTGELTTIRDAEPGAMWRVYWFESDPYRCGADGQSWCVRCPGGGDWMIDGRASNCCGAPGVTAQAPPHKCWTRSGTAPRFTVSPSIQTFNWHGWLRDGQLVVA